MDRKFLPPDYFFAVLAAQAGTHFVLPLATAIPGSYRWAGIVFVVFGAALNLWADAIFKKAKTAVKPHEMPAVFVANGPFRFSRNPMYLGMTAILAGAAVLLGSAASFIFPAVFAALMQKLFIPAEEKNMENAFGRDYLDYKKKVRRWI